MGFSRARIVPERPGAGTRRGVAEPSESGKIAAHETEAEADGKQTARPAGVMRANPGALRRNRGKIGLLVSLLLLLLLWEWFFRQGDLDAASLVSWARAYTRGIAPMALAAAIVPLYLLLLHLMFPLTVLVAATGLLFGAWQGALYASLGTLLFAATSFWLGHALGRDMLVRLGGARMHAASRYLSRRGVRVVLLISLLPVAPFALTNMLAGASHIRFGDYMLGSALGLLPGVILVAAFGGELGAVIEGGGREELLALAVVAVLVVAALVGLRAWLRSRYRQDDP